jgi:hypothetical protein
MLTKCANPSCSTPLVYLREGKIFMIESAPESKLGVVEKGPARKPQSRVEHFWLCGPCSSNMTLTFDRQRGVQVVQKPLHILRAAAS